MENLTSGLNLGEYYSRQQSLFFKSDVGTNSKIFGHIIAFLRDFTQNFVPTGIILGTTREKNRDLEVNIYHHKDARKGIFHKIDFLRTLLIVAMSEGSLFF